MRKACEEYVRRYGRPGSYERNAGASAAGAGAGAADGAAGHPLDHAGGTVWAAVYPAGNGTTHSHHVHQGSIVSAVYYSTPDPSR
jgi:hypothetical protein